LQNNRQKQQSMMAGSTLSSLLYLIRLDERSFVG